MAKTATPLYWLGARAYYEPTKEQASYNEQPEHGAGEPPRLGSREIVFIGDMVNPQDPALIEPRTNELAYYQLVRLFPRAVPDDGPPTQELEDECGLDWALAMALPCIRVAVIQAKEILDRRITPWATDSWGSAMEVEPETDGTAAKAASGTHVPLPSGSSSSSFLPPPIFFTVRPFFSL